MLFAGIGGSAVRTKIGRGWDGLVASGRGEIDGILCLEIDYWIIGILGPICVLEDETEWRPTQKLWTMKSKESVHE